jgi:hypothetical protein
VLPIRPPARELAKAGRLPRGPKDSTLKPELEPGNSVPESDVITAGEPSRRIDEQSGMWLPAGTQPIAQQSGKRRSSGLLDLN